MQYARVSRLPLFVLFSIFTRLHPPLSFALTGVHAIHGRVVERSPHREARWGASRARLPLFPPPESRAAEKNSSNIGGIVPSQGGGISFGRIIFFFVFPFRRLPSLFTQLCLRVYLRRADISSHAIVGCFHSLRACYEFTSESSRTADVLQIRTGTALKCPQFALRIGTGDVACPKASVHCSETAQFCLSLPPAPPPSDFLLDILP